MGRRLKHTSAKVRGLRRGGVNGLWEARKVIPADLRSAFGKTEFKQALNTKDENEAIRIGAPILADWNDQIAAAAKRSALAVAPVQRHGIDRDRAHDAIKRWKSARLKAALNEAFNGGLDPAPVGFSDEMRAHVQMVGDLRAGEWSDVPDFDAKLAAALNSQGVMCDPLHPAIPNIRPWFCAALARVEHGIMEYRKGNLTDAPEPPPLARPALVAVEGSFTGPAAPKAGMKLLALFDLWESSKGRSERRHRGYVQRLVEYLGDPDIDTVTALQMDAFLVELRKFPNTKRPIDKTPFAEAIAESVGRSDYRTLHTKTVWNWTIVYKALFEFAVDRDLIRKNPAAKMMKRPSPEESDERAAYDADDVKAIFGANLFNGFSGNGYRDQPGTEIVRDHKYWLPILALWTGGRVEELATLDKAEIKTEDGVHFIDLTERPLSGPRRVKNRSARRVIPVHDRLVTLGFMNHVARAKGPLFPELETDGEKASASFTKWWGRWCEAHSKTKGKGLDDPSKVFHSFRHAWKRTARASDAKEEVHDLVSGHSDGNAVARGYGRGVDLKTLKAAVDQIVFPTFPILPG